MVTIGVDPHKQTHTAAAVDELAVEVVVQPEISRHLTILRDAGLITPNRDGRYVQHQLDIAALTRIGGDTIDALLR